VKVAAAPESVPRPGARAALGIPEKDEEVHGRRARASVMAEAYSCPISSFQTSG
jgi:hypothetical protein